MIIADGTVAPLNELIVGGGATPINAYVGCMSPNGGILYGNTTGNYFGEIVTP